MEPKEKPIFSSELPPYQTANNQTEGYASNLQPTNGYPGVVGGSVVKGIAGYDGFGNPIIPKEIAQRHQIEQSLGPTCVGNGYHDLRTNYTTRTLLFSILVLPYCCGWRGERITVCKKCNQKFPHIQLPI